MMCRQSLQNASLIAFWWIVMASVPFLSGFGPPRVVDQIYTPSTRLTVGETEEWLALNEPPALSAKASLLYDMDADRLLFAQNADGALPIASLTKLMTALLILETGDLQAEVVVQASDLVGGTSMQLIPGEVATVETLLYGLLIPSGNDAAMALARHNAGSAEAFVEQMNARAAALNLRQTHFVNPHGLDAEGHLSSAMDLLTVVRLLWDYPLFREIVATVQSTVQGHRLQNTNELLGIYPGVNGIKTGTTDAAGQCLIAGFLEEGHQVIAIVLGSSDRYSDMRALYAHYQETYHWIVGDINRFSILNRLYDPNGRIWYLRTGAVAPTVLLPTVQGNQLVPYRRLALATNQPWQSGMQVGVIEWQLGNQVVGTQPLYLW
ncbi:MAG TPA: D-alanyl-D-alanine carboxypeptidase family protein [Caldilineaceae bacterium]|nr:D-alanyl-D-alanine carboxypeptidase family protein [Caldilineaceae bacterium]